MMQIHYLKTWPEPFQSIINGDKRHEIRNNDRDFQLGDILCLQEWDPETKAYTGREEGFRVSYITVGPNWGLPDHLCVMSITEFYQ